MRDTRWSTGARTGRAGATSRSTSPGRTPCSGTPTARLEARVPLVVGTTGFDTDELDRLAREAGVPCLYAPNFALGAVLMMRFAEEAYRALPRAEIVELHAETKLDAPSGTAKATAARMGDGVAIHSVRLPGLVAHQEVLLGGPGETLTIRHDTTSREAFVPGVLRAVEAVRGSPARPHRRTRADSLARAQRREQLLVAALLVGDLLLGRLRDTLHERVHRLDDEEEDRRRDRDEADQRR